MKTGIALFVYNRPEHTKKVLDGLRRNEIEKLYIFADGPKSQEHLSAVKEVRRIIESIDWCQTEVIISDYNKGLANSIIYGVDYVFERHERIIVLEDDCVPSDDFVGFMEECFERYQNQEEVMNVTGYSFPINLPENYKYDILFSNRGSSWGWGTWRRAWKAFHRDDQLLRKIYNSADLKIKVGQCGDDLLAIGEAQLLGKVDSWAIYWALHIIVNEGICISPIKPKIKNVGLDGSGTHCKASDKFDFDFEFPPVSSVMLKFPPNIQKNSEIIQKIKEAFSLPIPAKKLQVHERYYHLLNKWLMNIHKGIKIESYFIKNKINNIAIYGSGEVGRRLLEELIDSPIKIKYFIDRGMRQDKLINGVPVIHPDDIGSICSEIDEVVVTPVYDYHNILAEIKMKTELRIDSLDNIIEELLGINLSRTKHWKDFEYFDEQWKVRIKKMSEFIEEEITILDLGCGEMWLKEYISENRIYFGCDYIKRDEATIICDFNKKEFPKIHVDLCFISGCLEYVEDVNWFINRVCECCKAVVISYCTTDFHQDIHKRNSMGWANNLSSEELIQLFFKNDYIVRKKDTILKNQIFKFTPKESPYEENSSL
jgi:hypothetical protein